MSRPVETRPEQGAPRPLLPALKSESIRYGSAMLRRFGWFYRVLGLGRLMGRVRMEEHSAERVREAAAEGPIVYVLAHRSTLDHLVLNTVLNHRRLPLSVWANGVTSFFWQPVVEAWRDVARRVRERLRRGSPPHAIRSGWLTRSVAGGAPVVVFLQEPPSLRERLGGGAEPDPLDAILEAQGQSERPIQLLPVLVVWDRAPEIQHTGAVRWFLGGARDGPSLFTRISRLFMAKEPFVQVGEPLDLRVFQERVEAPRRLRALRALLRRALRQEDSVVRGPRLLPHRVMKRIVIDNPPMRDLVRREADATGRSPERVRRQMERDFDRIAANFRWWVILLLDVLLRPLWTRVYAGVDVREEDVEKIRAAMRRGSAILVPSHKSHFDYLLLSWVFYERDLIVPHVVAGMNLAIWPVSILLRGAGGFFIKRRFAGERIFPAVFARYLRELIRQGYPVEFFIEGGRSRSGKLLPPKLGVLGMVLEAAAYRPRGQEVTLLPIAFAYEQVAEEQSYARELGGESKRPESLGQVVKARSVLRRRFGRVYLRVGEPVVCSELVDAQGEQPAWPDRPREVQKQALQTVGERLVHRVGRVTVALPSSLVALALLAHHRRGIRHDDLVDRAGRLLDWLRRHDVHEGASLAHFSQALAEALARFQRGRLVEALEHDGTRVWSVVVEQRLALDFHKNHLLHYFATAGYVAAAARARPGPTFTADDLRPDFALLCALLRFEFVLDPDRSTSALLQDALADLQAHGALEDDGDGHFQVADPARMGEIHGLIRALLEAYALTLRCLPALVVKGLGERDLPKALQAEGRATDRITRPEALSLVTLKNAVSAARQEGALRDDQGALRVEEDVRQRLLARLLPMVE